MSVSLQRTSITGTEPVALAEMKLHLRVDFTDDDALILSLISAARERAELLTGMTLIQSQWVYALDAFPTFNVGEYPAPARVNYERVVSAWANFQTIEIPRSPLVSVSSIQYIPSSDSLLVTLDPSRYVVDTITTPGRVYPVLNGNWPCAQAIPNAVQISFAAGASTTSETICQSIKLIVGSWYETREDSDSIPKAAEYLLAGHRVQPLGLARP